MPSLVLCGTLIDGTGREPIRQAAILVEGDRIQAIGARAQVRYPADAEVIDLGDLTVLPGLIDSHDHLTINIGNTEAQCAEPIEYIAANAAKNARDVLRAGITTMRSLGEKELIGQMFRRAIDEGLIPGPRILTSGRNICRTGAHAWFLGRTADGPAGLRAAVRDEAQHGADLIKIMVSGGVATRGSDLFAPEFTDEEVAAVIDEAHRRGLKVAAHGYGGPGIRSAVLAGVDSIEHGAFATADDLRLMAEHGTYLVITDGVLSEMSRRPGVPTWMKDKIRTAHGNFVKVLGGAKGTGLKIAVGTDLNHGRLDHEMQVLVEAGYPPVAAFLAGTKNAADLCGVTDRGTLEAGKLADIIAVPGDPLADFARLQDVRLVMKGGKVAFVNGREVMSADDYRALAPASVLA